jgi:serine/threonine-protein kinase HipA
VKKLNVIYAGWGERWLLGVLADNGTDLLFEYSAEARAQQLELSPIKLALRAQAYGGFPHTQDRLPGLIADCLPDGWGRVLMDKLFRREGRNPGTLSPLDRLAWIGDRGLGALVFEPATRAGLPEEDLKLLTLAQEARAVIRGRDGEALREMALLGGSPQGARPKVLVHYDPGTGSVCSVAQPNHDPWLIKFQAPREHKEVCAIEALYATLARKAGLQVPETRYFELDRTLAAFGIARFDIESGERVPVLTLAGALDADFRIPSVIDYSLFLRVVRHLSRDEREVRKAYGRALFNVIFNNRDDHAKNFSFRLSRTRQWQLSPAYDLTYSEGPGGEHQMDVCGEGRAIGRAHLLRLAKDSGLDAKWALTQIEAVCALAGQFKTFAKDQPIRKNTIAMLERVVLTNAQRAAQ